MLKQVGNQNSNSLLRLTTFGLFTKLSFVFVSNKTFCCGCFAPPRLLRPGQLPPLPRLPSVMPLTERIRCSNTDDILHHEIRSQW